MILIPLTVLWAGYTLGWYGWAMLQGEGVGLTDLIIPSRVAATDSKLSGLAKPSSDNTNNPSYIPGPGVQPGSPAYPANPGGGLPSKPPLGGTPPAYYD